MRIISLLIIIYTSLSCVSQDLKKEITPPTVIAFGSCSNEEKEQPMWNYILQNNPNLWVWLGDIIYADTDDIEWMREQYNMLNSKVGYQQLKQTCPIIATWDDHDYGKNDGGKEWHVKDAAKVELLQFLGVPKSDERRSREGVYHSKSIGVEGQKVKIILLDCRYFRDEQFRSVFGYKENPNGTILGEAQWQWLENELATSTAQVNIIASGIQVIPKEHRFEKWSNFPNERTRLFKLIEKYKLPNTVIISGDRHIAEISKIELKHGSLYDITSSGLTHSYEPANSKGEANQYRVSDCLTGSKNFGLLKIDWSQTPIEITTELRGLGNELFFKSRLSK